MKSLAGHVGGIGAALTCLLVALIAVGCSRSGLDYDLLATPDGGVEEGGPTDSGTPIDAPIMEGSPPPSCGDGKCDNGETCSTCALDCGACPTCGNGTCDPNESCSNCPMDCGDCATCGDGKCQMPQENCQNCAPDCGVCPGCGDGICQSNETCFTCPADCGKCVGCGDGICQSNETCASCEADCGPCSVCGNGKCEPPYETCVNCSQDCGMCTTHDCLADLTCILGCFGGSLGGGGGGGGGFGLGDAGIPLTCLGDCVAEGCASAQAFSQDVVNCFLMAALNGTCMGFNLNCLMTACAGPITACIGDKCPTSGG